MRTFFLAWFLCVLTSSCASMGSHNPPHERTFFDDSPVGQSRAFKDYQTLSAGERAKISYLLWRIEYSPLKFWRNGSTYDGREGAAWLRWKMKKFYPDVNTAEGFINEVATESERTHVPYRVLCPESACTHNLSDILFSELHALEAYEFEQLSPETYAVSEPFVSQNRLAYPEEMARAVVPAQDNIEKGEKTNENQPTRALFSSESLKLAEPGLSPAGEKKETKESVQTSEISLAS